MSIFTNIHKMAMQLIPPQTISYRKGESTVITQAGRAVSSYGEWTSIVAHVQPGIIASFGGRNVSEKDYKDFGLDFSRSYVTIWTDDCSISTLSHQDTADQIKVGNRIYNIIQKANWLEYDGWVRCYCEEVIP